MNPQLAKNWKANQEAIDAFLLEEKRSRTPEERLRANRAFLKRLFDMGKLPPKNSDSEDYLIWSQIQRKIIERNR